MEKFSDPLLRQLLWSSFYQQTRDAQMKPSKFLDLVGTKCVSIKEAKLLQTVLQRAHSALTVFTPEKYQDQYADSLFESMFSNIQGATDDLKIIWAKFAVNFARTKKSVLRLFQEVRSGNPAFDQGMRWSILVKAMAWELEGAKDLLHAESEKDKSDVGERALLTAKTSIPDTQVKSQAWQRYLDKDTKLSSHQLAADMSGFLWPHQKPLTTSFGDYFFESVRSIFKSRDREFASSFFHSLFPEDPENPQILDKTKLLLSQLDADEKHLIKELKAKIDDTDRAVKCRKRWTE